ncbi:hypothetical protein [Engelhardtia mirabilis]|uniref:Virginiamycin B lyase n=1 Tax=Engelhardtia mirabilis TaxID=2528011 RepID=A0A518BG71_9BACT|nr:hypothetical protein Pla133_10310 [Planctomycetes bacterium Pla133]QDV00291.1 hypothetical protein Pla86_10300 [Planctomycetes bacterium Pla86]
MIFTSALLLSLWPIAPAAVPQELLVSGYNSDALHRFDLASGAPAGVLGAVPGAQSARYGPDGDLYVVSEKSSRILRFDGHTGAALGEFVADDPLTPIDETGGLTAPTAAAFGPGGDLFVADFAGDCVMRYRGSDGAFLGIFVSAGDGGIDGPDAGMVFGPEGDLYVPGFNSNNVARFDGQSGAFVEQAIPAGGELANPRAIRFRDDGWMYVASWANSRVLRVPPGGGPAELFAQTLRPTGLVFDPLTGDLLVTSDQHNGVRRYAADGTYLGKFILGSASGVDGATWLAILPDPRLRLGWLEPGSAGVQNEIAIRNGTAGGALLLALGLAGDSLGLLGCPGAYLGVASPVLLPLTADGEGAAVVTALLPGALSGTTLWLQAFDGASCRTSWAVTASL